MSEQFLGEIRIFAGSFAPQQWASCEGQTLQISDYQALYALIGTTYGGDGQTNFKLPDLRGRLPVGQGQGTNLTSRTLAQTPGQEDVTLTAANLPSHSHDFTATKGTADVLSPEPAAYYAAVNATGNVHGMYVDPATAGATVTKQSFNDAVISNTGQDGRHVNVMPSLAIKYIIALQGLFPERE